MGAVIPHSGKVVSEQTHRFRVFVCPNCHSEFSVLDHEEPPICTGGEYQHDPFQTIRAVRVVKDVTYEE